MRNAVKGTPAAVRSPHTKVRAVRLLVVLTLLPALLSACLRPPEPASGTLMGTATFEDGSPAAGATLTLLRAPGAGAATARTGSADAEGHFRLERVRTGSYWLTAEIGTEAEDTTHSAVVTGVEILEGEETVVNAVLSEAGAIAGVALLSDRSQDGGVEVSIPSTPFSTVTGAGGAYELAGVPAGAFDVTFTASGYAPITRSDVAVASGATTTLPELTLERTAPYALFTALVSGNLVEVDAAESYDVSGEVVMYRWDFGDGTRVEGGPELVRHVHRYVASGTYTIRLTVINDRGFASTASQEVSVTLPQLRLSGSPHTVTLPAGSNGHWDVIVPGGTRGDVLYIEVEGAESIQVQRGSDTFFSTAAGTFRLLGRGSASADASRADLPGERLTPQAIAVLRSCHGPCVLLPVGGATLTVHNPGPVPRQVIVHLEAEAFNDVNEPNDRPGTATALQPGADGGAIELVGDVDWFRVPQAGVLTFDDPSALELRASLHDAAGARIGTLNSGVPVSVRAGDLVEVRSTRPEAGPSAVSAYFLSLE